MQANHSNGDNSSKKDIQRSEKRKYVSVIRWQPITQNGMIQPSQIYYIYIVVL